MGFDFLRNYGGRRVRHSSSWPILLNDGLPQEEENNSEDKDFTYEEALEKWSPLNVLSCECSPSWRWCPLRFIDGKDVGKVAVWIQTPEQGYPIPVRLAEIGAIVMENQRGQLTRTFHVVERVVSLAIDLFPWDEVESFALALQDIGLRLLPCRPETLSYDFIGMRKATQHRTQDEMERLERQALSQIDAVSTLVDGRLYPRAGAFNHTTTPVVGLIKTHARNYLPPAGLRVLWEMKAGQRTPAFFLKTDHIELISWYLRLNSQQGELPDWGVVRLEIARQFFEETMNRDFSYINHLSGIVYEYRCRDKNYGRAPISISPIQRAEESLGALFTTGDTLLQRFYRYTQL